MKLVPGVWLRRDPQGTQAPIVFDLPRSGTWYPCDFRPDAPFYDLQRGVPMYLGELYDVALDHGATVLNALFPNTCIDANRHETDIDPDLLEDEWPGPGKLEPTVKSRLGIGLIHRLAGDYDVYNRKLRSADVLRMIDTYFHPYHNELSRIIGERHAASGISYHISCHSMASIGGRSTLDAGSPRSDFDIGDLNGQTCDPEFYELVVSTLSGLGYRVTRNFHFPGAECIRRHSDRAKGRHSLQIEINRKIYMDEQSFAKADTFSDVRSALDTLSKTLVAYAETKTQR